MTGLPSPDWKTTKKQQQIITIQSNSNNIERTVDVYRGDGRGGGAH